MGRNDVILRFHRLKKKDECLWSSLWKSIFAEEDDFFVLGLKILVYDVIKISAFTIMTTL